MIKDNSTCHLEGIALVQEVPQEAKPLLESWVPSYQYVTIEKVSPGWPDLGH